MDNHLEPNTNSNIFYDSLEDSKNQESSINDYTKRSNNLKKYITLTPNNTKNKKYNNKFKNNNKFENSKINENIKKIFQIPNINYLYTPITKKEENEIESPKFSYTEIPLYFDYSTHSSNTKNQSMFKRNNSSLNINYENTNFITNNVYQNTNSFFNENSKREKKEKIKEIKINRIPNSQIQNEILNKTNILLNNSDINSYRENKKENNSYNIIIDKNSSSNKKIVNNLFQNNFKKKNNISKIENNKKENNSKQLKNTLKKGKKPGFKELILNSSFSEKNKEKKDNKIKINKINLLLNKFNKNEKIEYDFNPKILEEKKEDLKNIEKNNDEYKSLENYDINNNSQNSAISTSLRNNPSQTNYDNYLDTGSFYFSNNNNNDNNTNNMFQENYYKLDINNNQINNNNIINNNNNNDNIFTLNKNISTTNKNNIFTFEENLDTNIFQKNTNLNNIKTDSSNENINYENKNIYIYNSSKLNLEQIQYERYNNLYNLLYDFLKWELILEKIKINLSTREDISMQLIFEIFDINKQKSISLSDISKTLSNFGMDLNDEDAKYILLQNNKRLKDRFNFNEFCEIILPNNNIKRKEMNERKIDGNYWISDKTKNIICLLFQKIIEGERSNEFYRNKLAMIPECSGFDLFNLMKKNYSVGIYKEDIDIFLSSRGKVFYNNETELIMKKLDRNKDGVVDYTEFLTEITPKFLF